MKTQYPDRLFDAVTDFEIYARPVDDVAANLEAIDSFTDLNALFRDAMEEFSETTDFDTMATKLRKVLNHPDFLERAAYTAGPFITRTRLLGLMHTGRTDEETEEFAENIGILKAAAMYARNSDDPVVGDARVLEVAVATITEEVQRLFVLQALEDVETTD